ncbi:MAG: sigma-54-dependent Fis family transcriptional regulator [Rubrivivax sp.]|nr:sigma-54-dependent Fis family transcriptional regulator [Rubrivivax sp.]
MQPTAVVPHAPAQHDPAPHGSALHASAGTLRRARSRWLESGEVAPVIDAVLARGLRESWQRSREHGLVPAGRPPGAPHASGAQLARALERRRVLVAQARPVMEFVVEQIRDSGHIVILADAQGMLLQSIGDTGFADKAARVALRPGAVWLERWRGTNAIGTAIAAQTAVAVLGAEHYLERNAFLSCAAAPIFDAGGTLSGVLDISGDRRGDHRHALGLVRSAACMVEHQLFQVRHRGALQLRLHGRAEGIGTFTEGLVAVSEDGWVIGANPAALAMLGLPRGVLPAMPLERVLGVELATLLRERRDGEPRALPRAGGAPLWLRLDGVPSVGMPLSGVAAGASSSAVSRPMAGTVPRAPADALAALDTGDGAMQAVIGRARRVLDKPIALLLQGESGVGKEVFARACHASGPRRGAPFVAVNCAALPETLIEAELFGYRPGAFTGAAREGAPGRIREAHGGTLFLDEIGDMPLALQARLLRVLQDRQVLPLGGGKPAAVDFALVCATHRQLRAEVDAGRFREDLYYRVNGLVLQLPPLRERSDLAALVAALLREIEPRRALALAPQTMAAFARCRWPGNLRQLANVLRTACALLDDDETLIGREHLPDDVAEEIAAAERGRAPADHRDPETDLRRRAGRCVREVVAACGGNLSDAARRLGISRNTLYRKLRELERSGA